MPRGVDSDTPKAQLPLSLCSGEAFNPLSEGKGKGEIEPSKSVRNLHALAPALWLVDLGQRRQVARVFPDYVQALNPDRFDLGIDESLTGPILLVLHVESSQPIEKAFAQWPLL